MKAKTIFSIDPVTPEPDRITKAGKILQENGVVIFPAKCLYEIGRASCRERV